MTDLPVREMVLYKHGVGFFVRAGAASGADVELTFRKDEINDVLKSLAVFDEAGGQILGIHYQTPMDRAARLASSSINLGDHASLDNLLNDLRGRKATLEFEATPGTVETVSGRVIGIDGQALVANPFGNRESPPRPNARIVILTDDGQVRVFQYDTIRGLRINDGQAEHDLSYFLDTSMSEDDRRTVNVRLNDGDHDLTVYYVAPSPTWRVSYRLVAEADESGATGRAQLQGWGLFDNRLDEDLTDVKVTLVAGQPISFIYDLYASRIPLRPTVQDESRIAPGPIEYEGAYDELAEVDAAMHTSEMETGARFFRAGASQREVGAAHRSQSRLGRIDRDQHYQASELRPAAMISSEPLGIERASATKADAEAKDAGETFQYAVATPVTVKRGESALVPIVGSEIKYERELLYNQSKLPHHPVVSLRFDNATGLTLERGPVTVVEDGDYRGEAVIPFTKDGNQIYLPYAVELGVKVTERSKMKTITTSLDIKDKSMVFQQYQVEKTIYTIENATDNAAMVTIEAPVTTDWELYETNTPDIETTNERRWRVNIPAKSKADFVRQERHHVTTSSLLRKLNYSNLNHYLENRWLDRATFDTLSGMLDKLALIQKLTDQRNELVEERKGVYEQQKQLRANLGALQPTGQEATLRNRLLGQLETSQNRLDEIEQQLESDKQAIADAEIAAEEIIAGLSDPQPENS